jgi:hypothetical protein
MSESAGAHGGPGLLGRRAGGYGGRMRALDGTLHRFDSVTKMIAHCRQRFRTDDVRSANLNGEFILFVRPADRPAFDGLIVHFEGERVSAVMLPDDP